MKIREYQESDLDKITALAEKHNLLLPSKGLVNLAEGETGVIGMILVRMVPTIEPFICTNPMAAKKLFDITMQQLSDVARDLSIIRCYAKPEHVNLYKKLGFYEVFNNQVIMEKGIHNV